MNAKLPSNMVTCEKCGKQYATGDWPFCPHGKPQGMFAYHEYYDENLEAYITSFAQKKKLMKARNLEFRSPKVGRRGCEV